METVELGKKMDLDTAYIEPLIHEWLQHIHEDNAKQLKISKEGSEFTVPYIAVPLPVIKTIFVITGHFGLGPNAKYLTVHLFDQFMRNHFSQLYLAQIKADPKEADSTMENLCKTISREAKLRFMSCMQLASKMDSHSKALSISQVIQMLRWMDDKSEYTKNAIYTSEFYVYKTVHFKIPLFTPLHCVEILLAATKLRSRAPEAYDVCVDLLDLAYLHFVTMQRFAKSQCEPGNITASESNLLYLGAAVVLSSSFILSAEESDVIYLVKKLSNLVRIPEDNIRQMAKLLFAIALLQEGVM